MALSALIDVAERGGPGEAPKAILKRLVFGRHLLELFDLCLDVQGVGDGENKRGQEGGCGDGDGRQSVLHERRSGAPSGRSEPA